MFNEFNLSRHFYTNAVFKQNHHLHGFNGRKMLEQLGLDPLDGFFSNNRHIGDEFVAWQRHQGNLPTYTSRRNCFTQFAQNCMLLRAKGLVTKRKIRFIDKFDYALNLFVVRSLKPEDAVHLYKRQMSFLSMYATAPNPFQTIRDLFDQVSIYNRPIGGGYTPPKDFAGSFVNFLLDYYLSLYIPNEKEWRIYLMQQRRALNEIEHDVFTMLNGQSVSAALDNNGELQVTAFSTIGLEMIANILRPVRIESPQIETFATAFTDEIWMNYFPYTWALVNPAAAAKLMNGH